MHTSGTCDTVTDEDWRVVMDTNLAGTWNTCRAAIPLRLKRGGGSMVDTALKVDAGVTIR